MSDASVLKFGRIDHGYVVRVEGRGTLHDSPALHEFVTQTLQSDPNSDVVLDLAKCEYLDSTFLGCLVSLHNRFARERPPRFVVAASAEPRTRLLTATRLDRVLIVTGDEPGCPDEWSPILAAPLEQQLLGRHLMECHRRLAELGGPRASAFAQVADQLSRELNEKQP